MPNNDDMFGSKVIFVENKAYLININLTPINESREQKKFNDQISKDVQTNTQNINQLGANLKDAQDRFKKIQNDRDRNLGMGTLAVGGVLAGVAAKKMYDRHKKIKELENKYDKEYEDDDQDS